MRRLSDQAVSVIGWYGTTAILLGYGLLTAGAFGPSSLTYIFLNLTGSVGLVIQAQRKRDSPLVVLNAVWVVIAVFGLIKANFFHHA